MPEVIDAANIAAMNTTESLTREFTPEATDSHNDLGEAITSLWVAHANAKVAARATNEELRLLRAKLGEQLSEMKQMLAKPGRGGQWSSFLMERNIPRATADRLVARHLRSLNPSANCINEEVSEPTDDEVQKLFIAVWPKLRRTLRSQQSIDLFIALLTSHCGHSEPTDEENPVVTPDTSAFDPPSLDRGSIVESDSAATLVARAVEELI